MGPPAGGQELARKELRGPFAPEWWCSGGGGAVVVQCSAGKQQQPLICGLGDSDSELSESRRSDQSRGVDDTEWG